MNNPEMIELKNKLIFGLIVAIIIVIPIGLLFFNKLSDFNSKVYRELRKNETFLVLLINSNDCSNCNEISKILEDNNVSYYRYDILKQSDYADILKILDLDAEIVNVPALIYIKDGKMEANMMNITSTDMVMDFLSFYKFN